MQVVDFTGLMQFANKLCQACWFHQVASNLWTSDSLQLDICRLAATWWNNLHQACMQFATCSKSVNNMYNRLVIIKPEQAMRTPPDIGLVMADLLQLAHFWLCKTKSKWSPSKTNKATAITTTTLREQGLKTRLWKLRCKLFIHNFAPYVYVRRARINDQVRTWYIIISRVLCTCKSWLILLCLFIQRSPNMVLL